MSWKPKSGRPISKSILGVLRCIKQIYQEDPNMWNVDIADRVKLKRGTFAYTKNKILGLHSETKKRFPACNGKQLLSKPQCRYLVEKKFLKNNLDYVRKQENAAKVPQAKRIEQLFAICKKELRKRCSITIKSQEQMLRVFGKISRKVAKTHGS